MIAGGTGSDTLHGGAGAPGSITGGSTAGAAYVFYGGLFGASDTPVVRAGGSTNEVLLGAAGDDTLSGGGGYDVFRGGAGGDTFVIGDPWFRRIDGGHGTDLLKLGWMDDATLCFSFNLGTLGRAQLDSVERIDIVDGDCKTLRVDVLDVLNFSGGVDDGFSFAEADKTLVIEADADDLVILGAAQGRYGDWDLTATDIGLEGTAGGGFDVYDFHTAEFRNDQPFERLLATVAVRSAASVDFDYGG